MHTKRSDTIGQVNRQPSSARNKKVALAVAVALLSLLFGLIVWVVLLEDPTGDGDISGSGTGNASEGNNTTNYCDPADVAGWPTVIAGNTAFAFELYTKLRTQEGDLFLSPYSISSALAMTCGGARGETEKQMARALHFDLPPEQLHPAFAALAAELANIQKKGRVNLSIANSLWPQKGHAFLPDYLDLCKKKYGTTITPLDYVKTADLARMTINNWVENRTNKKITKLIAPGVLNALTRMVLVNAIYFKGDWDCGFRGKVTRRFGNKFPLISE